MEDFPPICYTVTIAMWKKIISFFLFPSIYRNVPRSLYKVNIVLTQSDFVVRQRSTLLTLLKNRSATIPSEPGEL